MPLVIHPTAYENGSLRLAQGDGTIRKCTNYGARHRWPHRRKLGTSGEFDGAVRSRQDFVTYQAVLVPDFGELTKTR